MWNDRYNTKDYIYGTSPNEFLVEYESQISPKGNVLCLADGEGRNSVFLAKLGYNVTAVDMSSNAIEKAKMLAKENDVDVDFVHADLTEFVIVQNHWDAIVSIFCHLPLSIRKQVHKNTVSGLKSGGKILLEAYTPDQLKFKSGGPQSEDMMMSIEILRNELSGLNFILADETERDVVEGLFHTGLGAVVRLIAEKP